MPVKVDFVGGIANYRFSSVLGETRFIFDVRWNGRDNAWYFDWLDEDEEAIVSGIKITLGTFLGSQSSNPLTAVGVIVLSDLSGAGRDPTFDDLGERCPVHFFTKAEVDDLF